MVVQQATRDFLLPHILSLLSVEFAEQRFLSFGHALIVLLGLASIDVDRSTNLPTTTDSERRNFQKIALLIHQLNLVDVVCSNSQYPARLERHSSESIHNDRVTLCSLE